MLHLNTLYPEKKLLLAKITDAENMACLFHKCRGDDTLSYNAFAAYLRKIATLINHTARVKSPKTFMHVSNFYVSSTKRLPPSL